MCNFVIAKLVVSRFPKDHDIQKQWVFVVKRFRFRFRCIYLVILQTQETCAKTKFGHCRRGHLEKNKVYSILVCKNNSNY